MNLVAPDYRFCPFCGGGLTSRIEEEKSRKFCKACNWTYYPRVAASVTAVISRCDSVLLVKRLREPFAGKWMFPSGFVDFGEHPEESLKREILEETGLTMNRADLIGVFQSPDDWREPGHFVFFYRVDVENGEVRTDPHENSEIGWFDVHEAMPEIGWQLHRRFLGAMWADVKRGGETGVPLTPWKAKS
jgi:NADH pyrophosphatase NudC (nudix superfamily)